MRVSGTVQCKVRKGSKTWYAILRIPSLEGKQKWERIGKVGDISKAEALRYLRRRIEELERNFGRDVRQATFSELAHEWMESLKLDKKPHTISSYQTQVNHDLIPFFGNTPVSSIVPEEVERFKRETREKVSATTTNYDLRILRQILETGIRWGYLYTNPAKLVKRLKQEQKEFRALTREDVTELLKAAETLPCSKLDKEGKKEIFFSVSGQPKTLLLTAVCTALRQGELLAMKWKNLDPDKGTYTVKEAYSAQNGFGKPKTDSSLRTIPLPKPLLEELRKHRIRQNEFRLQAGGEWQDNGLIFTELSGGPMDPDNMRRRIFNRVLKQAKLPHIRFHDLRGTAATLALESGASVKAVQNLLGHSTPNLTLSVYAKVTEASQKDLADKLAAHLGL